MFEYVVGDLYFKGFKVGLIRASEKKMGTLVFLV